MKLFDTHAHLSYEPLDKDLDGILQRAQAAGLIGITAIATELKSSYACHSLAHEFEMVYASVGIHPNDAHNANDEHWVEIKKLAADPNVVAIGETGLDLYWDDCPFDIQKAWFARHFELSYELKKPLVVHMRNCETEILDALAHNQRDNHIYGIMHSFTGSKETAERCLEMGMFISFAGMVTFKKSVELREVAKMVPDDRLLIETDSPYLSPHPHRGKRPNEPARVVHTAECLAEVRGVALDALAELTTENARNVFGL